MEKMRKTICLIGFILMGATVHAQEKEGHLSAVSRNLEIFNDLYTLITANTEEALYAGIKKLLDDPKLLAEYKQKGEARGWDFDIEALMVPVENLLQE